MDGMDGCIDTVRVSERDAVTARVSALAALPLSPEGLGPLRGAHGPMSDPRWGAPIAGRKAGSPTDLGYPERCGITSHGA